MDVSENTIVRVSAILVIVGLGVLWYAGSLLEEHPLTYDEFLAAKEVRVSLQGELINVREGEGMSFAEVLTSCSIPAVAFDAQLSSGNGTIIGTKTYYKGKPEIIIEEVRLREMVVQPRPDNGSE